MAVPDSSGVVKRALLGALVFLGAEFVLFRGAGPERFGPASAGWFLNSGHGVVVVAVALTVLSAGVGVLGSMPLFRSGSAVALGAIVAMVATLILIGPGNIFPIVIAAGMLVISAAVALGLVLGAGVRRARASGRI
jgi:hypothetical protein